MSIDEKLRDCEKVIKINKTDIFSSLGTAGAFGIMGGALMNSLNGIIVLVNPVLIETISGGITLAYNMHKLLGREGEKWNVFSKGAGLSNKVTQYPNFKEKYRDNKNGTYIVEFDFPAGITTTSFDKLKQELEQYFNIKIIEDGIIYENKKIYIEYKDKV